MSIKNYSYGKQSLDDSDIQSVIDVLKSDWLTQGPKVHEFESALCGKLKARYASAVSNGTASLHLIALGLGWGKDDVVITSPITFLASANCILYAGAIPDFADIDPKTYTIDPDKVETVIKKHIKTGKKAKAIVAVDFAGQPSDWEGLKALADKYHLQLVNDYAHALGAEYKGDAGYAVKYADAVNLSFHPVKQITTGEGGAVLTNSEKLNEKINILRTHGMTKDPKHLERNDGPWYYEMHDLGFNYRITDFQCALGLSQLKKLDAFIERRNEIAAMYDKAFKDDERFITPYTSKENLHARHLYPLQVNFNFVSIDKKKLFQVLKEKNINLQVHYIPVHLQPYYRRNFGFKHNDFPISENFYENEISLPLYYSLSNDDVAYVISTLKENIK